MVSIFNSETEEKPRAYPNKVDKESAVATFPTQRRGRDKAREPNRGDTFREGFLAPTNACTRMACVGMLGSGGPAVGETSC